MCTQPWVHQTNANQVTPYMVDMPPPPPRAPRHGAGPAKRARRLHKHQDLPFKHKNPLEPLISLRSGPTGFKHNFDYHVTHTHISPSSRRRPPGHARVSPAGERPIRVHPSPSESRIERGTLAPHLVQSLSLRRSVRDAQAEMSRYW